MSVNRIYFRMRKTFLTPVLAVLSLSLSACVTQNPQSAGIERDFQDQQAQPHTTPDWAKGLVWYQVFPERFRNGNPHNDPQGWDLTMLDWDSDFGATGIEEIERAWNRGRIEPERFGFEPKLNAGALPNVIYARRYGGDLQGVLEQLESIKNMGFGGVYLCPVFQSRSLHKYDASDHRHIDPTLGSPDRYEDPGPGHTRLSAGEDPFDESTWRWTPSDRWFVEVFLPRAKELGLRVMLDGVWNHVGTDHFGFADVRREGQGSDFADWFEVVFDEEGELIGWQGWSRVNGSLPEFRHTEADLAPGPKAHIMAVTRRWMDPNGDGDPSDGIDGWRLDVAGEIGEDFWRDWRAQVKSINEDALIVAEIWGDASDSLNAEAFDAQMNYPFAYPVADWLSIGSREVLGNARVVVDRLEAVYDNGPEVDLVQLNLLSSHDTERLASLMQNRWHRMYDNESSRWFDGYESQRVSDEARDRAMAAIATMVACPGAMMIYNGDEFALTGADDPDNRRPIPWEAINEESTSFAEQVGALVRLRSHEKIGPVLRLGEAEFDSVGRSTLIIRRYHAGIMIEFMIAPSAQQLRFSHREHPGWVRDRETEKKLRIDQRNQVCAIRVYAQYAGD